MRRRRLVEKRRETQFEEEGGDLDPEQARQGGEEEMHSW